MDMKDCSAALSEWRKLAVDKHVNLFTEVRNDCSNAMYVL